LRVEGVRFRVSQTARWEHECFRIRGQMAGAGAERRLTLSSFALASLTSILEFLGAQKKRKPYILVGTPLVYFLCDWAEGGGVTTHAVIPPRLSTTPTDTLNCAPNEQPATFKPWGRAGHFGRGTPPTQRNEIRDLLAYSLQSRPFGNAKQRKSVERKCRGSLPPQWGSYRRRGERRRCAVRLQCARRLANAALDGKSVAQKNTNNAFPHSSKKMIWGLLGVTSVHGHHAAAGHSHHGHQSGLFGVDSRAGGRRHRGLGRGLVLDAAHGDISFGGVRHARCILRTHKSLCRINHQQQATTIRKRQWRVARHPEGEKRRRGAKSILDLFIYLLYGTQSENRQKLFRPPTPSREEAAQARLLDARRILSISERWQGSFQGRVGRV